MSVHDERSVNIAVLEAGANGFVLKRRLSEELLVAVDEVLAGRCFASPNLLSPP
jgi:DNA-binding NarL/FixJ family response regulator